MEPIDISPPSVRRRTGRPLSFDRDAALDAAMHVFWRHGYETSSIADLTAAMGITPPSLYTAFGDKKRLFLEAVDRYAGDLSALEETFAEAATARDAAHDLLHASAIAFTGETTPPGCLLASATASGSEASRNVQQAVSAVRSRIIRVLADRIARDAATGILPKHADPHVLAQMTVALIQGMSTLARDGAPREALVALADAGLRAWPTAST